MAPIFRSAANSRWPAVSRRTISPKWDEKKWPALGEGPNDGMNATVHAMSFINRKLFVGRLFAQAGTKHVNALTYFGGWRGKAGARQLE